MKFKKGVPMKMSDMNPVIALLIILVPILFYIAFIITIVVVVAHFVHKFW
jgi:hypothetical protein